MIARQFLITLLGWTLWHDVGIYHAAGPTRLGGQAYAVTAYGTEIACHAGRREAIANEGLPRRGPLAEPLADGVQVWDQSRQHYTTFRYRCSPTSAHLRPMP